MPQRSNSARYLWGDRNPVAASINAYGTYAPHVGTVRASYTVPAGKKSQVSGVFGSIRVVTVATPPGIKGIIVNIVTNGINVYVLNPELGENVNTIGQNIGMAVGHSYFMQAGEVMQLYTSDTGTGGTVIYQIHALITTYDA